jgi:hypothetical protein
VGHSTPPAKRYAVRVSVTSAERGIELYQKAYHQYVLRGYSGSVELMLDPEDPVCKQRCGGGQVQVHQEEALPQADKSLHAQSGRLKCLSRTAE